MQSGLLKCFSSIIENLRNNSRLLAICLDIYLSAPKTEDRVSSTKDMIDFLSPLLEELILALLLLSPNLLTVLFLSDPTLLLNLLN